MKVKTKCRFPKLCKYPHTEDGECDKFCSFNTREVKTNADRIRAMSDEELAEFMCHNVSNGTVNCAFCSANEFCHMGHNGWLDWLKQEAEDG